MKNWIENPSRSRRLISAILIVVGCNAAFIGVFNASEDHQYELLTAFGIGLAAVGVEIRFKDASGSEPNSVGSSASFTDQNPKFAPATRRILIVLAISVFVASAIAALAFDDFLPSRLGRLEATLRAAPSDRFEDIGRYIADASISVGIVGYTAAWRLQRRARLLMLIHASLYFFSYLFLRPSIDSGIGSLGGILYTFLLGMIIAVSLTRLPPSDCPGYSKPTGANPGH